MKYICDVTNIPIPENNNVSLDLDARDHENSLDWRDGHKELRKRLMISEDVAKYLIYFIKSGKLNETYQKRDENEHIFWLKALETTNETKND